jgi:uncharacterized protein (TIGR03437 family)
MLPLMWRAFLLLSAQLACAQTGLWEQRAPYPLSATEVSGAAVDRFVYMLCGLTPQGSTNRVFRYDPRVDTWAERASLPIEGGADHCNVAAANGKLYMLGGIRVGSSFVSGETWEYDPALDRWQRAGQMNTPRGASGVAVIGNRIYVAGGLATTGSVADFEVFDTTTRQWTRLPSMPAARDHLTAQAVNGRIYAIAGRAGRDFTANEEYDPGASQWRSRAPIPTARGGLGSGTIDNRIQVFGGEGNSGTPSGTFMQNEEYDPSADTWRVLAPIPTPRHGLYGVTLGRRIFAAAGGPMAGAFYTNRHEAFFLPPAEPPRIRENGVVNAASGQPVIAPGSLVSIFGDNLAPDEQVAVSVPFPSQMNSVAVRVNGEAVPLQFVSRQQINFFLPLETANRNLSSIVVSYAGAASTPAPQTAGQFQMEAPGIFTLSADGQGAVLIGGIGLIARAAGERSRPARRGEVVEIYATGLGSVSNPPPPGAPGTAASQTTGSTIATIGGVRAEVLYSGLAPGLVGVYQVNALIPASAPAGDRVPIAIQVGEPGLPSNAAVIAIQ